MESASNTDTGTAAASTSSTNSDRSDLSSKMMRKVENDTSSLSSSLSSPLSSSSQSRKTTKATSLSAVASKRDLSMRLSGSAATKLQKSTSTKEPGRWDSFDYLQHWYPVSWSCDVLPNRPTKVTLFDVDYVIAKKINDDKKASSSGGGSGSNGETQWTALIDRCPHKAAALSEGRLTASGHFQCAYHGWSFNGKNGNCVQIPQAATASTADAANNFPRRACATPVPIREHQSMVWLWPGPWLGEDPDVYPDPPTVPEMDLPGWKAIRVVRDFGMVDWPLLASNIMDPDHGLFAHGALPFDWYSANAQHPMRFEESFPDDGRGWRLSSQVPAVDKILATDDERRKSKGLNVKKKKQKPNKPQQADDDIQATSLFMAPTTVSLARRDAANQTKFVTAFWVSPVGTGKSRFMSAAISPMPFTIPRWILQINLNRFLDQDTLLVASQQPPILTAEAQGVEKPRSSLFAYGSATDKTVRLIDQFWDATLHKVPNRQRTLQQLYQSGQLQHTPPREVVLDRQVQHLAICPDSQGLVRNCKRIRRLCLATAAWWMGKALWQRALPRFKWIPILCLGMAWITDQLRQQYYFVKTEASRDKDLKQIPVKAWLDPE